MTHWLDTLGQAGWMYRSWQDVLRVLAVGVPAYIGLILLLRISGKRTLSKMNAFDLVVTVAFGSTFASVMLSPTTTLAQGLMAFAFLVFAQYVITWLTVRSRPFQRLIKAYPSLLYYQGQFMEEEMRRQRVTRVEIEAAARQQGQASIEQVAAVVLETDGSLSILSSVGEKGEGSFVRSLRQDMEGGSGDSGKA